MDITFEEILKIFAEATNPEIAPKYIEMCTAELSDWYIEKFKKEARPLSLLIRNAYLKTLEHVILVVDLEAYQEYRPALEDILQRFMEGKEQVMLEYCDKTIGLIHLNNQINPMREKCKEDFKRLMSGFFREKNYQKKTPETLKIRNLRRLIGRIYIKLFHTTYSNTSDQLSNLLKINMRNI